MATTHTLAPRQISDLELLGNGGFKPLQGFQGQADWRSVVESMRLADGTVWPIPVTLASDLEASVGDRVELADAEGQRLGYLDVEEVYERDLAREAELVYRTTDEAHPGVAALYAEGSRTLAGPVSEVTAIEHAAVFEPYVYAPQAARAAFKERGWRTVVAFQTRNPVHRAHEYLIKCALENVDGLFPHPIVGETKSDDIPAEVRMRCYEALIEGYFPAERVLLGVNPAAMRYAGPREAVFHAIVRRNYGATHFIVGRDHAGVGSYYGTYDAHRIFDDLPVAELGITPLFYDHSFWCERCEGMASTKTCPHSADDHIFLSGTKVRQLLEAGELPPQELTRPEVAKILIDAARVPAGA